MGSSAITRTAEVIRLSDRKVLIPGRGPGTLPRNRKAEIRAFRHAVLRVQNADMRLETMVNCAVLASRRPVDEPAYPILQEALDAARNELANTPAGTASDYRKKVRLVGHKRTALMREEAAKYGVVVN